MENKDADDDLFDRLSVSRHLSAENLVFFCFFRRQVSINISAS